MSLHHPASHRETLRKIADETPVDDLLDMLKDIAANQATLAMTRDANAAAATKWLIIERALARASLTLSAGGL